MRFASGSIMVLAIVAAVGCSEAPSDEATAASGSASSTTATSSGSGMNSPSTGYCQTADDCGGQPCIEITPGGYKVCDQGFEPTDFCTGTGHDECCDSSECPADEECFGPLIKPYCGDGQWPEDNLCAKDECQDAADCGPKAACAPRGAVFNKVRICIPAACLTNAECTGPDEDGSCAPVKAPCCGAVELACVYPSDGCKSSTDCLDGRCLVGPDGRATCVPGEPMCTQ